MERRTPGVPPAEQSADRGRGIVLIEKRAGQSRPLRLQSQVQVLPDSWTVRLPVRAEYVHVSKQVVVSEEVVVRRDQVDDVVHATDTIHREEVYTGLDERGRQNLTVEEAGMPRHLASTERLDTASGRPLV